MPNSFFIFIFVFFLVCVFYSYYANMLMIRRYHHSFGLSLPQITGNVQLYIWMGQFHDHSIYHTGV